MAVLDKLGMEPRAYVEACKFRNSEDLSADAKAVFFDYAQNDSPEGPTVSDSRYITEDVPEGLVMLESLGSVLQIATPACSALIDIASACLNRDFRDNGRTVQKLELENIQKILGDTSRKA